MFSGANLHWFGSPPGYAAFKTVIGFLGQAILRRYSQWFVIATRKLNVLTLLILASPQEISRTIPYWYESRSVSLIFFSRLGVIPIAG